MANAVNSTAIIANSTASGVIPPANDVAAPIDSAVATAGAMWVIDWNSTSGSPMASRSRDGVVPPTGRSFTVITDPPLRAPIGKKTGRRCWGESAGNRMRSVTVGEEGAGDRPPQPLRWGDGR